MAERGAHITSASVTDRPTIFEVLAQESLMVTVRPALKHAIRVAAENRPALFGWLLRNYDEMYAFLDFIIQHYHLQKYNGSFAENFYDLKRVPSTDPSSKLSHRHHWLSVFLLVAVPYIKTKLDQLFEDLRHKYGTDRRSQIRRPGGQVIRAFLSMYPYVHMTWEGTCLLYQVSYMLGKGAWHSPFLHLSGTRLQHLDEFDLDGSVGKVTTDWSKASLFGKLILAMKMGGGATAMVLSSGLSVGMFFLQFLDWWYASDSKAASLTAMPIPDPPGGDRSVDGRGLSPFVCPICGRARTNDTALSVSGYVFCYPCIHGYVKHHGQCPVTQFPATPDHLIKIFVQDS
ncbi:peroxisome assembly protein 12-like [Haliotis asinina]|uniref:peroxisome assembly protein 12-like n=1 Tax=Haliotis asinina TaxID=109174 RepID=UPI0035319CF1